MENAMYLNEDENKRKGFIISLVTHAILLLLCFLSFMQVEPEPEQLSGVMVAFGEPDNGNSRELATVENISEKETKATTKKKAEQPKDKPIAKPKTSSKPPAEAIKQKTVTDEEAPIKAVESDEKQKLAEAQQAAEEAAAKEAQRIEAEKQAAEEAARQAEEARQAQLAASKNKFSDLLGSGRGNNDNAGNQGQQNGDPNAEALDGIASGSGRIGGGLSNRGLLFEPSINDNSQKKGRVVIKVCVDKTGSVTDAKYTQRGSTTTDKKLIDVAITGAKKYKFTPSEIEKQCGTITVDFKLQ